MILIKEAIKSLLALILLAGFLDLLLLDDGMRKYTRMVIGLIVLFSLINLVIHIGRGFSMELPVMEGFDYPETEVIVAEGLKLRRQGEDQAAAYTTPALQAKVEEFLNQVTGTGGIKVEIDSATDSQPMAVRIILTSDPGVPAEFIRRTVAELLAINPVQVEVEQEVEDGEE